MALQHEIRITPEIANELKQLLSRHDKIEATVQAASECDPATSIIAFAKKVGSQAAQNFSDTRAIIAALLNLKLGQDVMDTDADRFMDAVNAGVLSSLKWDALTVEQWNQSLPKIKAALSRIDKNSSLMLSSKAQFLTYQRERVFSDARIISDIRPVFDNDATTIRQMIVTHSLAIDYRDDGSDKTIYITLDSTDLARIRQQCDRADAKAAAIVASLSKMSWPTIVFPETD